jgi:hypothetical protein
MIDLMRGARTPTTVYGRPLMTRLLPTTRGSLFSRDSQNPWLTTARAGFFSAAASTAVKARPIASGTPSTSKKFAVTNSGERRAERSRSRQLMLASTLNPVRPASAPLSDRSRHSRYET